MYHATWCLFIEGWQDGTLPEPVAIQLAACHDTRAVDLSEPEKEWAVKILSLRECGGRGSRQKLSNNELG